MHTINIPFYLAPKYHLPCVIVVFGATYHTVFQPQFMNNIRAYQYKTWKITFL